MRLFLIILITLTSINALDNPGFLQNQKYACMNLGAIINKKVVPILSDEEAKQHPSRFYIDDNMTLYTDGKVDNKFKMGDSSSEYISDESIIFLSITDGKRYMYRTALKGQLKGIPLVHLCVETKNWTLVH